MPSFTNNSTECSDVKMVKSIYESWENALNHGVRSVVEELLHPDFVWLHNQAEMIQRSKLDFLNFFDTVFPHSVSKPVSVRSGIREQRNVKVIKHRGQLLYMDSRMLKGRVVALMSQILDLS